MKLESSAKNSVGSVDVSRGSLIWGLEIAEVVNLMFNISKHKMNTKPDKESP